MMLKYAKPLSVHPEIVFASKCDFDIEPQTEKREEASGNFWRFNSTWEKAQESFPDLILTNFLRNHKWIFHYDA